MEQVTQPFLQTLSLGASESWVDKAWATCSKVSVDEVQQEEEIIPFLGCERSHPCALWQQMVLSTGYSTNLFKALIRDGGKAGKWMGWGWWQQGEWNNRRGSTWGTGPDTTCTQRPNYILLQSQQANKH